MKDVIKLVILHIFRSAFGHFEQQGPLLICKTYFMVWFSFPEVLSEFTDFTHDKEYNNNLTFYLVLALAAVSFLFITCLVVIISVKIYRWRQSRLYCESNLPVIPYYPPRYADTVGTGTLQHGYNYEVYRTTDSRRSDCKFVRPGSQNVLIVDSNSTLTVQRAPSEKNMDELDSPVEVRYYYYHCCCCCVLS